MSWIVSLFNPAQSTRKSYAPSNDRQTPVFSNVQDYENGSNSTSGKRRAGEYAQSTEEEEEEYPRHPYWQCMIAGGLGGTSGDLLMHSIDTVKTRQQGDPHKPPKYGSLSSTYVKIFRQEGFRRGLYSGVVPAFLGSFPGTIIFFGAYEYSKRHMLDAGINPSLSYLAGGFIADFAASFVYVPSEVLKTRLQLQGRYNNPFFNSGYNYRGTIDAARTIVRREGVSALFHGYKATIFRDLPFSALQFAFYEQERNWAKRWKGSKDLGVGLEIATAASAGGLAGVMTCPLDVVKTRIQTQINPPDTATPAGGATNVHPQPAKISRMEKLGSPRAAHNPSMQASSRRLISTSSPNTSMPKPDAVKLDTSSVVTGLRLIYKTEGMMGLFRGVGPRAVWTSVQSGTMLVCYQALLKRMEASPWLNDEESGVA